MRDVNRLFGAGLLVVAVLWLAGCADPPPPTADALPATAPATVTTAPATDAPPLAPTEPTPPPAPEPSPVPTYVPSAQIGLPTGWAWYDYPAPANPTPAVSYALPTGQAGRIEQGVEDSALGYAIAYPAAWQVTTDAYDRPGMTQILSPETGTEVRVYADPDESEGMEWFDRVREQSGRYLGTDDPPERPNVYYQGLQGVFVCQLPHPGLGAQAALMMPQGGYLVRFYLYSGQDEAQMQADAAVFQRMIASFSPAGGHTVSRLTIPADLWCGAFAPAMP